MDSISVSLLLFPLVLAYHLSSATNNCSEFCGNLSLPYPFHLNSSCGPHVDAFRLTCVKNSSLYLTLGSTDLRVISFLHSYSLLLDYSSKSNSNSNSTCDRWYADLNDSAAVLDRSTFFAVTPDNVLRLYDCDDSSVCRSGCERVGGVIARCEGGGAGEYQGCCYPLSDGSVWKVGQGFKAFGEYGCRGFSSWVAPPKLIREAQRGIEVEWAVPMRLVEDVACANGAVMVNSTVVKGGYRRACGLGLVGDGFAQGIGCSKSCSDVGHSANADCCDGRFCEKRVAVLVGILISALFLSGALAVYFLVKVPDTRSKRHDPHQTCLPKILGKARMTRSFTYQELNEATKVFDQEQQPITVVAGTIHMGVIDDGSPVAVQKINCESEQDLRQVWEIIEILSQVSHKNIGRIMGRCIGSNYSLLVVHEFSSHGTLEEHLQRCRGNGLGWQRRINIAIEVASALSFLESEISPPINLHDLKSSEIFIDAENSIKIACFKLLCSRIGVESCSYAQVVYNFGLVLLELITGSREEHLSELTLLKIKDRRYHEIVDPYLRYGEQPPVLREQIERMAIFAVKCLARKMGERVSMVGVAREMNRYGMEDGDRTEPGLEVTFSPDSIHVL